MIMRIRQADLQAEDHEYMLNVGTTNPYTGIPMRFRASKSRHGTF